MALASSLPDSDRRRSVLPAWAWPLLAMVLLAGFALTWQAWQYAADTHRAHGQVEFDRQVDDTVLAVQGRMAAQAQLLRAAAGLFAASSRVERSEWRAFAESLQLDEQYPGLQGLGYAQLIAPGELADHERAVRAEGFEHYVVRPRGQREVYSAIVYLEPFAGRNLKAFGFDMFSEPVRRAAMMLARDSGQATLSGKVTLVQEGPERPQAGSLLYMPVYRPGLPLTTQDERRAAIAGFAYSPFRMDDLMRAAVGGRAATLAVELFDGEQVQAAARLYESRTAIVADIPGYVPSFGAARPLTVGQRAWTLRFATLPAFDAARQASNARWIGLAGALLTLGVAGALAALLTMQGRAVAMAEGMTMAYRRSEARAHAVVDRTAEGIVTTDFAGRILSANPAAQSLLEQEARSLGALRLQDLLPVPLDELAPGAASASAAAAASLRRDVDFRRADGTTLRLRVAASVMVLDGAPQYVVMLSDVTAQMRAEQAAAAAGRLNEAILHNAPFAVIATDTQGRIRSANPAAERLLWYASGELIGRTVHDTLHVEGELRERAEQLSRRLGIEVKAHELGALAVRSLPDESECHYVRKDGSLVAVNLAISVLRDADGSVKGFLGMAYDITERKRTQEQIQRLAHHDILTDLPNRALLADRANVALQRATRAGNRVGVLLLDLDHFKQINDSIGHHGGDLVLQETALRLRSGVRQSDTVARLGGDEFCVLLSDLDDAAQATLVADKIAVAMQPPMTVDGHALQVTPSIGVAVFPDDGADLAALLRAADAAMYAAKRNGRDGHSAPMRLDGSPLARPAAARAPRMGSCQEAPSATSSASPTSARATALPSVA